MNLKLDLNKYNELIKLPKDSSTGLFCEECGAELIIREGYNKFLGCSGYPICKNTYSLEKPISVNQNIGKSNFRHLDKILFEDALISEVIRTNSGRCSYDLIDIVDWHEGINPIMCKDDMY